MKIKGPETALNPETESQRMKALRAEVDALKNVRNEVFERMLERGKPEYARFVRGIRAFKHLSRFSLETMPHPSARSMFLENYYMAMRHMDDIIDGDAPLPQGCANAEEYISQKITLFESGAEPIEPEDDFERMMFTAFKLAKEFGADFREETKNILGSLLFDAKRRSKYQTFNEKELHHHFFMLDIKGTASGDLKVFKESIDKYPIVEPLGEADRIYYNLRDLNEDLKAGFINISAEDCGRLGIAVDVLKSKQAYMNHSGVRQWIMEQAEKGLMLIEEYRKRKKEVHFKPAATIALKLAFEQNAKSFMESVANGNLAKVFER